LNGVNNYCCLNHEMQKLFNQ